MPKPQAPLYLAAPAPTLLPGADAAGPRGFAGVAYSGGAFAHWAAAQVIIDLASVILPSPCPVLESHDRAMRVGFCTLAVQDHALTCRGTLLRNPRAAAIAADADEGFPWQMSVHAEAGSVREYPAGQQVSINGRLLTGPLTVYEQTRIREVSFTPTGVDDRTSATVLEWPAAPPDPPDETSVAEPPAETDPMTIEELQDRLNAAMAAAAEATSRAETAEAALAASQRAARLADVTGLFADLGRPLDDAGAAPYLELSATSWAAVRAQLSALRPAAPAALFADVVTDGQDGGAQAHADALVARMAAL